jgi:hypothetical protein
VLPTQHSVNHEPFFGRAAAAEEEEEEETEEIFANYRV